MADFSIIVNHPDCEEIISKIMTGSSPKEVYQWLKLKYPNSNQSHLRITQKLLKELANSPLTDLHQQFKKDYSALKQGNSTSTLQNNPTYKELMTEFAGKEIDTVKMIENLVFACHHRVQQVFDIIQENPRGFKGDNYLLRYLSEITMAAERLNKAKLDLATDVTGYNVTMEAMEQVKAIFQETIRDTLAELDPEVSMKFLDRLNHRLEAANLDKPSTQAQRIQEAEILEAKILGSENSND